MNDMLALAKASAWVELLDKATKVPPSERDAAWNALVAKAANARVGDTALTDEVATSDAQALMQVYPHLASDRAFMDTRARRGMPLFNQCFREDYERESCNREALAFVRGDPKNAGLARDMAMLVAHSSSPKYPAAEYFYQAVSAARVQGEGGANALKEICASSELGDATASALANVTDPSAPLVGKTRELAFDWCWPHMNHEAFAKAALDTDAGFANACAALLAKQAVSGVRESKCKKAAKK
jgi:hypothetical protein